MPPANSPSDTRPSTPPGNYLRQLEEAISRPVPDLASTLNPTPTRSTEHGQSRTETRVDEVEGLRLERAGEDVFARRSYLTETEFQNWSTENRTRAIMQSQRARARARTNNSNPREGQRQSYATSGLAPTRQSIYDWAVSGPPGRDTRDLTYSDDSDQDMDGMSTAAPATDISARRDLQRLERALQSYRSARNALRSGAASDVGAVPTASALRAYWTEEDNHASARSRISSTFWNQPRQGMQRRRPTDPSFQPEARLTSRADRKKSDAFLQVRKLIRYLSQLRHTGDEGGLESARQLGLDSLYASGGTNTPSDLPMHINSIPVPSYTSWLEPGMVWHGLQSTERHTPPSAAIWAPSLRREAVRRERQQELFRRTLARRREMAMLHVHDNTEQPPSDSLLDAERYLSDLLQDSNGRWAFSPHSPPPMPDPTPAPYRSSESDHWPVTVTIHSVDYNTMTLTGTMSASHMPEKLSPSHQSTAPRQTATTSMSSFFTGEIIDFRQQPLETEQEGRNYDVGGLDVDASYWARLGPFKKEIERVRNLRGKGRSEYEQDSQRWEAFRKAAHGEEENKDSRSATPSTEIGMLENGGDVEEDREAHDNEVMARSLGSEKWMAEMLGNQWILMRWKERCFVTPSAASTASNPISTILTTPPAISTAGSNPTNGNGSTSWGLTISGFYYIALNRLTGEVDGLYYDRGSQPYQALKMVPEGMAMDKNEEGSSSLVGCGGGIAHGCGCGEQNCKDAVGLRKWFPCVEVR